jgi:mRNA-degrading endonuclease RelE of RelBE toxin-antitoxin system
MRAISITPEFTKEFIGLSRSAQRSCLRTIEQLRENPASKGYPYQGEDNVWLAKVWPYRLFFTYSEKWIHMFKIKIRQGAYDQQFNDPGNAPTDSNIPKSIELSDDSLDMSDSEKLSDSRFMTTTEIFELCEQGGVAEEDVAVLSEWDRSSSMIEAAIEMNLPEELSERLFAEWQLQASLDDRQNANVLLVRNEVISSFFQMVENLPSTMPISGLTIVSPWITPWSAQRSSLGGTTKVITRRNISTKIVTLPPVIPKHIEAIDHFNNLPSVSVFTHPKLHAKFYICDADPMPFALVASANSTQKSMQNSEVGILVKGRGDLEGFVRDLQSLAVDLMAESI